MATTTNHIEEQFKALEASDSPESSVFESGIGVAAEKISEVVGSASENKSNGSSHAFTDEEKKGLFSLLDFGLVSSRINRLVGMSRTKNKTLPSPEKQVKLLKKSLQKEQSTLFKKAKKIQNARRFSAARLEQVLLQLRQVQKLLKELVTTAKDQIEMLYRKYVLKTT